MNRSSIYIDNGYPVTIGQLLISMHTAPVGSMVASYHAAKIYGAMIQSNDFPEDILNEIEKTLKEKGEQPLTIGSPENQQTDLVKPAYLTNYVFVRKVDLDKMWNWIKEHFLPHHVHDYDWFALLRFLIDNDLLKKGCLTTTPDFCCQMNDWYTSQKCKESNVKVYRTGYLGNTSYKEWTQQGFDKHKRKNNQKQDGFNHLNTICNVHLDLAWEEDNDVYIKQSINVNRG